MKLVSVNIGKARAIKNGKASGKTGIYKFPVEVPLPVRVAGLPGDTICDTENHGGVDQALYLYGIPDYEWWAGELGRDLAPGTFGENLTISDFASARFSIGDRFQIGSAILEVTAPRIPCLTLNVRMADPAFGRRFRAAERPGLYCRVIQEGQIQVGDRVHREPYRGATVTAIEMFRDFYEPRLSEVQLRRYLAAPIAIRDRVDKAEKLAQLLALTE
jgi:MOSC domain-containing protein YiiM